MAREVIIRIRDDLDSEALADKTVPFSYLGTNYEIDLTAAHADEFDAAMARYIGAARVVVPEKPARKKPPRPGPRQNVPEHVEQRRRIRAWAAETGYHVQAKGVLAADIIKAYAATHAAEDPVMPETWMATKKRRRRSSGAVRVTAQQGNDAPALDFMVDMTDAERANYAIA